jgi:hypothetical protein
MYVGITGAEEGVIWNNENTDLRMATNNTERMRINSAGSVGIGTTSPVSFSTNAGVQIKTNTILQSVVSTQSLYSNNAYYDGAWKAVSTQAGYAAVRLNPGATGDVSFHQSSASYTAGDSLPNMDGSDIKMTIKGNGSVGIGVTPDTNFFLTVQSTSNDDKNAVKLNQGSTALRTQISFNNPNGQVGTIQTNGSATSYNTSSDYRLKQNITPMTGALAKVALLKPVTYKWKVDGSDGEGFIAHELSGSKTRLRVRR